MSKFRPCTVPLKDGRTLLLREGEGADAAPVSYTHLTLPTTERV